MGDSGAYGFSPDEWRSRLTEALSKGDFASLQSALDEFGGEIKDECRAVSKFDNSPFIDRLVEQARKLVSSEPTDTERLRDELKSERRLWAEFRQQYRETFVPDCLHPYLVDLAVFLAPSADGPIYKGFDKYSGCKDGNRVEAVTLFDPHRVDEAGETGAPPPNFYTSYIKRERHFIVHRAYRSELPRGSGEACLFEHIKFMAGSPPKLDGLSFENVQNSETYNIFVVTEEGDTRESVNPDVNDAPLVRLGRRLMARIGITDLDVRVALDSYGFMDLHLSIAAKK